MTSALLADALYEEPLGASAPYPAAMASWQYVGVRFMLDQPCQITNLHTELGDSTSSFFAALISLPTVTSLPQGEPFAAGEVMHSEIFSLAWYGLQPMDIPFAVTVDPGAYAIVFGGGQFGSTANMAGVVGTYNSLPDSTGFVWIPDSPSPLAPWHDTQGLTFNVSVEGEVVPEPSRVKLCLVGIATLCIAQYTRRLLRRKNVSNETHLPPNMRPGCAG